MAGDKIGRIPGDVAEMTGFSGRRVVLGITGGIAAYKAAELCRLLVKAGAEVRVVMTAAATQFITPLTLQTLSGRKVAQSLFDLTEESEIGHIRLADEADLLLVAPATADFIARLAAGMADDLLTTVALATRAPILLAPAMNVNMWENPVTQENLARLLGRQGPAPVVTVGPDAGPLACGWIGAGRLIEPAEILDAAARLLEPGELHGRSVVVTAGPTFEPIDDVRFLGNRSSGKMGFAIAAAAAARGASVTLIAGPVSLPTPARVASRVDVESAAELGRALEAAAVAADVVVMAAAVADFRPAARTAGKLSRRLTPSETTLTLTANPDLLARLGHGRRGPRPLLVGFAAEAAGGTALAERAQAKLAEKRCDVIVANDISEAGIGFGAEDNAVTVVFADGSAVAFSRAPKSVIADRLWTLLAPRLEPASAEPLIKKAQPAASAAGAVRKKNA
jgi:phosphopantothenoylcysteine decarboxylase/phosphopantothenate--cysteine ligase